MEARPKVIITTELELKAFIADAVGAAFKYHQSTPAAPDADPYGDFKWLKATCNGVPESTLRIKSAAGEIPGVIKFGKRVLYDKAAVLNWLRSQTTRQAASAVVESERSAGVSPSPRKSQGGDA